MNPVYVFKQSASFGKGLLFQKGTHRVDPKIAAHPYFQKLVAAGLVVKAGDAAPKGAAVVPAPSGVAAQQKASIDAQHAARKAKADEPAPDESNEDDADEDAKSAKSGKKRK